MSFCAGATNATILVRIINDAMKESNEYFLIGLAAPSGENTLSNSVATITIIDNDYAYGDKSTPVLHISKISRMSDGTVSMTVGGTPGAYFEVEVCEVLGTLNSIWFSTILAGGSVTVWDEASAASSSVISLYRLVQRGQ